MSMFLDLSRLVMNTSECFGPQRLINDHFDTVDKVDLSSNVRSPLTENEALTALVVIIYVLFSENDHSLLESGVEFILHSSNLLKFFIQLPSKLVEIVSLLFVLEL